MGGMSSPQPLIKVMSGFPQVVPIPRQPGRSEIVVSRISSFSAPTGVMILTSIRQRKIRAEPWTGTGLVFLRAQQAVMPGACYKRIGFTHMDHLELSTRLQDDALVIPVGNEGENSVVMVESNTMVAIFLVLAEDDPGERVKLPPRSAYSNQNCQHGSCSICTDDFNEGDILQTLAPCGHAYHPKCINRWLREGHITCPNCRKELPTNPKKP